MNRIVWSKIKIANQQQAFVAVMNGREIGTIAKLDRVSAWTVMAGIGEKSCLIGTNYDKATAKRMLVSAPESFWTAIS